MSDVDQLLVICGPTATGKTQIAIDVAKQTGGELVSADSRQVYIGMDIGTGKDINSGSQDPIKTKTVVVQGKSYKIPVFSIQNIPIWLYDVVRPDEDFSVSLYHALSQYAIGDITQRKKLPVIVGGSGLYVDAAMRMQDTFSIPPNAHLRKKIAGLTVVQLQTMLSGIDKTLFQALNNSDRNNPRRLIRKIEVASALTSPTHKLFSLHKKDILMIGLTGPLSLLESNIAARVQSRLSQGFIDEVRTLLKNGYNLDLPSMSAMGYQFWKSISEESTGARNERVEAVNKWIRSELQYAKRQLTWFRKNTAIHWFDISDAHWQRRVTDMIMSWYTH